jgi:hypothetical protein
MLELKDDYCKIMNTPLVTQTLAYRQLGAFGTEVQQRLINEKYLEVRKFRSAKEDHCAVVKCSKGVMWNIPRSILEGVEKKKL